MKIGQFLENFAATESGSSMTSLSAVFENDSNSIDGNTNVGEIDLFFQATAVCERFSTDPLIWWKANQARFPLIAKWHVMCFL